MVAAACIWHMLSSKLALELIVDLSFLTFLPVTISRRQEAALCASHVPQGSRLQAPGRSQVPQSWKRVQFLFVHLRKAASVSEKVNLSMCSFIHS